MKLLIQILQFFIGLSIIVGIHELGHLLFAKLCKMRVNSYMIGFPPKIFKLKWGDTEYSLGSIPLGGAVQVAGMVDESLAAAELPSDPQPWEFRAKPAWQRLLVILGGIVFNLLGGMAIYITLAYATGHTYLPKDEVNKYGIKPSAIAIEMGFKEGDRIVKINGKDFEDFRDLFSPTFLLSDQSYYTICRAGNLINLPITPKLIEYLSDKKNGLPFGLLYPCLIAEIAPNSTAYSAGLLAGDQVIAVAGQPTPYLHQLFEVVKANLGSVVEVTYVRNDSKQTALVALDQQGLPIRFKQPACKQINYSFMQALSVGFKQGLTTIYGQLLSMWKLLTGKLSIKKSVGGPIRIALAFNGEFIWPQFWTLVANLSIVIGLTNLFPLPALDGGQALLILYELLSGRKPSERFLQSIQAVGMILLFGIMIYLLGNDIVKLLE